MKNKKHQLEMSITFTSILLIEKQYVFIPQYSYIQYKQIYIHAYKHTFFFDEYTDIH